MGGLWTKLRQLFARRMEIVLVGLDHSGKTTFLSQLSLGEALPTAPTLGLNVRHVRKGNLHLKVWDLGGGAKYRSEWARYARGTDAIIFVVDSAASHRLTQAKKELHMLLEASDLEGIPLLILSNKSDIDGHLTEAQVIKGLNLDYIAYNQWALVEISALRGDRVERAVEWLVGESLKVKRNV